MDRELLLARAEDTANHTRLRDIPCFLGFLTEEEASIIAAYFKSKGINHSFFGGFPEAERRYLACLPSWCIECDFPIVGISFSFKECYTLSHRDFLGALMSLGITRECVGDILVEKGRAVVFLNKDMAPFVVSQIEKVGNVGVDVQVGFSFPLPSFGKKQEFVSTVSSMRLDNVVCALCGVSRNEAAKLIEDKRVSVCGIVQEKLSKTVSNGDRISVRGKGFFTVVDCTDLSKKGKIILKYEKFI